MANEDATEGGTGGGEYANAGADTNLGRETSLAERAADGEFDESLDPSFYHPNEAPDDVPFDPDPDPRPAAIRMARYADDAREALAIIERTNEITQATLRGENTIEDHREKIEAAEAEKIPALLFG